MVQRYTHFTPFKIAPAFLVTNDLDSVWNSVGYLCPPITTLPYTNQANQIDLKQNCLLSPKPGPNSGKKCRTHCTRPPTRRNSTPKMFAAALMCGEKYTPSSVTRNALLHSTRSIIPVVSWCVCVVPRALFRTGGEEMGQASAELLCTRVLRC